MMVIGDTSVWVQAHKPSDGNSLMAAGTTYVTIQVHAYPVANISMEDGTPSLMKEDCKVTANLPPYIRKTSEIFSEVFLLPSL